MTMQQSQDGKDHLNWAEEEGDGSKKKRIFNAEPLTATACFKLFLMVFLNLNKGFCWLVFPEFITI